MILVVTLNPLLERRFTCKKIISGKVNRDVKMVIAAGGKGINVSRQLKMLGVKSFNFIFSGGSNGKLLRDTLKNEGLDFSFVPTKTETREASVNISEEDKIMTSCFSHNPQISLTEVEEFKLKLEKMIQNCEIVIFSGSSPSDEANSIIPFGIDMANKYDKVSICDTYGKILQECIDASPTILHNNNLEINSSLGINLKTEDTIINFLTELYKKNIKRVYLTKGDKPFYASNFNYYYRIEPLHIESIDSTGSGDSFVAGLTYSWLKQDVFKESLKLSSALAGLNAGSFDVCRVKIEDALRLKEKVKIGHLGKKIKVIDDSPHEI
jgi:1-phosphofructokinase family hexose kinase